VSPTPPGAASATGSTDSESDSDSERGRSDDATEEVPVVDASVVRDEPAVEDEPVGPPHPPPYDQRAVEEPVVPYDQTATEDAQPTLAEPPAPAEAPAAEVEPEPEPEVEPEPLTDVATSANGDGPPAADVPAPETSVGDDTRPLDAPIGRGGTNGFDYGDQPVYAEAPAYGDPSAYGDQPVYDGGPVPTGQLTYGDAPGDELAYGAAPVYGETAPTADPSMYGDQFAYGASPVPTDQLTYNDAPAYGEPYPFGPPPMVDAPFTDAPAGDTVFGQAPVTAPPPWAQPQPEVPAGPVLLPPPAGTPGRGVRTISRPKPKRPATTKGRRVRRVVRRIELWSVLKVSLLFYFCMYLVALGAAVLLWGFAYSAGLIDNFESFMADIGFEDFQFFGDQLFKEVAIVGAVLVVAGALLTVLAIALVNLISEVTGGVRFVVIEIDTDERPPDRPSARPS
jgi:hypothetical protein